MSYYENKKILVTGAQGNLGSRLIDALKDTDCIVTGIDIRQSIVRRGKSKCRIIDVEADITNAYVWQEQIANTDIVFHFASQTSSYYANAHPLEDMRRNLSPVIHFIEAAQQAESYPDILFAATVTQAGITNSVPCNEMLPDRPVTVYDINKLAAEKYLEYYARQLKGRSCVLRLANLYGPNDQYAGEDRGILTKMITKAMKGEILEIFGDGSFMRDYVFIDDVVEAFLTAGSCMGSLTGEHYVIGSGTGHAFKDMIDMIKEKLEAFEGGKVEVNQILPPEGISPIEFRNFVADTSVFTERTGWRAKVTLNEGIDRVIEHLRKREQVA